ncbi:MAG TPA: SDR family NAD(P)-dependent oxidoreductase [Longimicrobiaceae bacterium]
MSDSVVLITGGAGNLGRAVTRAFLESGARAAVPVYKADGPGALDPLKAEFGDRLYTFALDLTTERGADAAVEQVVDWGGRLDAVAHLVGAWTGGTPLAETPVEAWDRMMDLNLKSAFLVARAALPVLASGGGGSLVFISSRAAREGRAGNAAYAVSKAALCTLCEAIAEEYGAAGIRANALMPGTLDTEANRNAMPGADRSGWTSPEEVARRVLALAGGGGGEENGACLPVSPPA